MLVLVYGTRFKLYFLCLILFRLQTDKREKGRSTCHEWFIVREKIDEMSIINEIKITDSGEPVPSTIPEVCPSHNRHLI